MWRKVAADRPRKASWCRLWKELPGMANDILIVDDEADIRMLITGILQDEGYDTCDAGNSDSALDLLRQRRPSLVVLDIWLENSALDGMQMQSVIKRSEEHTSELQSLMRISYAVFCLKKKTQSIKLNTNITKNKINP